MLSLVMNPGLPEEQVFPIPAGARVTIGRTKDNVVFCLHKSLSRKHAELEFDGALTRVTDLDSKNGVFHNGKRVARCDLGQGETFRCGDITFLVEGTTGKRGRPKSPVTLPAQTSSAPVVSVPAAPSDRADTLPSPLALAAAVSRQKLTPAVTIVEEDRYKDRLFLLIRASELCASHVSVDRILEELVALTVQVLEVDRMALLSLDPETQALHPRVLKSFASPTKYPYSNRVVDWVVDHGSPASFGDVSRDRTLPGDPARDAGVHGAMCVPINAGAGTIGVVYVDSLTRIDGYRPDDLALLRAIANLAAIAIDRDDRSSLDSRKGA